MSGEPGKIETLSSGKIVAKKDGYVYVYTSNESQQDVFFDNLGVMDITGPILEETHYYPDGLTMAGISTVAPLRPDSRYKYNDKELNRHEFSDLSGLDWYDYGFRNYDAQLGRFMEQDPLTDMLATVSPYQYALNDPAANIDKDGLFPGSLLCPGTSGFTVFMEKAGELISHVASAVSPTERAISLSAHILNVGGTVGNVIAINNEINNHFTDQGVGMMNEMQGSGDRKKSKTKKKKSNIITSNSLTPALKKTIPSDNTRVKPVIVDPVFQNVTIISGPIANRGFPQPPYPKESMVSQFRTTRTQKFVRVSNSKVGNGRGAWLVKESSIKAMTPKQIKDNLALKYLPDQVGEVEVPTGTLMRAGPVGPNEFGPGNLNIIQYQLMENIPNESFLAPEFIPITAPIPEFIPQVTPIEPIDPIDPEIIIP